MRLPPVHAWGSPDVPAGARLLHAVGTLAVPGAGGAAQYMDGVSPLGGTGYLVRRNALDTQRFERMKLIGVGIGYHGRIEARGPQLVAAAGTDYIEDILAIGAEFPYEELVILGEAGLTLVDGPTTIATLGGKTPGQELRFRQGVCPSTWAIHNPTGAGLNAFVVASLPLETRRADLDAAIVLRELDSDGAVAPGFGPSLFPAAVVNPYRPEPLLSRGHPTIVPVAAEGNLLELGERSAWGVRVKQETGGLLNQSVVVVAHLVVAAWNG